MLDSDCKNADWEALKRTLAGQAEELADAHSIAARRIPSLELRRFSRPTGIMGIVFEPILSIILQGRKFVTAGNNQHEVRAGQCLIARVDLPSMVRVVDASPDRPYLAMSVKLDLALLRELADETAMHSPQVTTEPDRALYVDHVSPQVVLCARRLIGLLAFPEAASVCSAGVIREIHYWLLSGRYGAALRKMAAVEGHHEHISRSIAVLRRHYAKPISVDDLARHVGMSRSSFHQYFRAHTSMSPLQFQKQLRLLAARRMMLTEGFKPSKAALEVGYHSISQFTREYGRVFGEPPRRDVVNFIRRQRTEPPAVHAPNPQGARQGPTGAALGLGG